MATPGFKMQEATEWRYGMRWLDCWLINQTIGQLSPAKRRNTIFDKKRNLVMANPEKAIYNLQRFQILQTKVNPQTESYIPDAYAYAWYDEVYPIMHESDLSTDLEEFFKITKDQIDRISKYADDEWLQKRLYTFYEYEDHFGVRVANGDNIERHTLIAVFKYIYLSGGFDDDFWAKLLEPMQHPAEAQSVTSKFDKDSIYFI